MERRRDCVENSCGRRTVEYCNFEGLIIIGELRGILLDRKKPIRACAVQLYLYIIPAAIHKRFGLAEATSDKT